MYLVLPLDTIRLKCSCTSLTDDEGSYQSCADVFWWADVGVVEFGQAIAVLWCWTVGLWEGPLIRYYGTWSH